MITESELKEARYKRVEKEADAIGRLITVRKLRPSEEMRLNGFTIDLAGTEEIVSKTGEKNSISHRMPMFVAACVCEIDGVHIPFPNSRGELDAIYDRLDREGIDAAVKAYVRLVRSEPVVDLEQTKNSSGTPPFAASAG